MTAVPHLPSRTSAAARPVVLAALAVVLLLLVAIAVTVTLVVGDSPAVSSVVPGGGTTVDTCFGAPAGTAC